MAIEKSRTGLVIRFHDLHLEIIPWGDDALRVRATRNSSFPAEDGVLLPVSSSQEAVIEITGEEGTSVALTTGITDLEVQAKDVEARIMQGNLLMTYNKGQLGFYRADDGMCLLQGTRLIECAGNALTMTGAFRSLGNGTYRVECQFKAWDGERFYGLGQHRHGFLDQKGCVLDLFHHNCEINIPFLISSRGYGFIWNNPSVGKVELGRNRTAWVAEQTQVLDFVVKAGKTPADILRWYADVTGHPPLLPQWASGFWQCKLRYRKQEELLGIAREYKRRNLPLSAIVIDYFHWSHSGDFSFDEQDWPDPEGMVRELREMGVELVVSNWPTVSMTSRNFGNLHEEGCLVQRENGPPFHIAFRDNSRSKRWEPLALVDPTTSEARERIWDLVEKGYGRFGIRAFWLDAIEPELITEHPDFTDIRYHAGNAREIGARYPWHMQQMYHDGMKAKGETEFMTLCRSGYLGSQRFGAAIWSGDIASSFESLRSSVRSGLNMAMSGIPWWCTDIGGFHGGNIDRPEFRELIVRWFQYGLFCPIFRLHGCRSSDGGEGFEQVANEVWSFGEEAECLITQYLHLRERLRPYIHEQMAIAASTGLPVIRPMFVDFPHDSSCWDREDQFMFGPDFLIAPITEAGSLSREVYLQEGTIWKSAWDHGLTYEGGRKVMISEPFSRFPVLVSKHSTWLLSIRDVEALRTE